jgi:DinB family protein
VSEEGTVNDEERRVRSYLVAQGAKLTPAAIIEKVLAAMAELGAAARAVPADRFNDRPAPGEWSANEVMAHVVDSGRRFGDRIVRVLDGLAAGSPVTERAGGEAPPRTVDAWSAELERDRSALFERVLRAEPAPDLAESSSKARSGTDRAVPRTETIEHGTFGPLDWRATLLFLRVHDLDHAGQLQKIAAALAARRPA